MQRLCKNNEPFYKQNLAHLQLGLSRVLEQILCRYQQRTPYEPVYISVALVIIVIVIIIWLHSNLKGYSF